MRDCADQRQRERERSLEILSGHCREIAQRERERERGRERARRNVTERLRDVAERCYEDMARRVAEVEETLPGEEMS